MVKWSFTVNRELVVKGHVFYSVIYCYVTNSRFKLFIIFLFLYTISLTHCIAMYILKKMMGNLKIPILRTDEYMPQNL